MTKYTFQLAGESFADVVHKNGYQTDRKPVVSWSMTDLTGVTHEVVSRWAYTVTLTLNPMTAERARALCEMLQIHPLPVTFTSLQTGEEVEGSFRVEEMPLAHQLTARGTDWMRSFELVLQEL